MLKNEVGYRKEKKALKTRTSMVCARHTELTQDHIIQYLTENWK